MASTKASSATDILTRRYGKTKKARQALEEARASAYIARQIVTLREDAGLTQAELAKLVGTSRTVITRLEDDDYEGHSLSMLRRIAAALNKRVEIRFVALPKSERVA